MRSPRPFIAALFTAVTALSVSAAVLAPAASAATTSTVVCNTARTVCMTLGHTGPYLETVQISFLARTFPVNCLAARTFTFYGSAPGLPSRKATCVGVGQATSPKWTINYAYTPGQQVCGSVRHRLLVPVGTVCARVTPTGFLKVPVLPGPYG